MMIQGQCVEVVLLQMCWEAMVTIQDERLGWLHLRLRGRDDVQGVEM